MKHISMALAAAIALAATTAAQATAFTVTYIGTVNFDFYGNFLAGGQSALGDAYSETFVVDPATPGAATYNSPGYNYTFGTYNANPVLSDTLTIAGQSFSAPARSASYDSYGQDYQITRGNLFSYNEAYDYQNSYDANGYKYGYEEVYNYTGDTIVPAVYGGAYTYTVQPGDSADGVFETVDYVTGKTGHVRFTPTEIIFGAVPEPSTWVLMLAGFGLLGTALRRRRTGSAHLA